MHGTGARGRGLDGTTPSSARTVGVLASRPGCGPTPPPCRLRVSSGPKHVCLRTPRQLGASPRDHSVSYAPPLAPRGPFEPALHRKVASPPPLGGAPHQLSARRPARDPDMHRLPHQSPGYGHIHRRARRLDRRAAAARPRPLAVAATIAAARAHPAQRVRLPP